MKKNLYWIKYNKQDWGGTSCFKMNTRCYQDESTNELSGDQGKPQRHTDEGTKWACGEMRRL